MEYFVHKSRNTASVAHNPRKITPANGQTKITSHWWGVRFYISHSLMNTINDYGTFVAALMALGGLALTILIPISAALYLSLATFKLFDKGKGIILTKYGWVGPIIPSTQK